jgi:3-deoxy-D-manno-octulosonic-acid transferase
VTEAVLEGGYRGMMGAAAGLAGLAARMPGAPQSWRGLGDRLGRLSPEARTAAASRPAMWLHAASVGELTASRPLIRRLRERFPERLLALSTVTRTGLELARTMPEAHLAFLLPLDSARTVRRLLSTLRLEVFFFTETEIWPTLLAELAEEGVPAFMVSGRVSERTVARARWLRPLYRRALASVTCCMQTEEDAARVIALGADPRWVQVAGSLKFDGEDAGPPEDVRRFAAALDAAGRRLLVAGSTHEGEEAMLLDAYGRLAAGHKGLVLLLAPRHPERFDAVAKQVRAARLPLVRYSELTAGGDKPKAVPAPGVVLLDAVGPLPHCYALGFAAFVGGSLVPAGGHNVLEPARAGRPIIVGPHTENARDVVDRLIAGGGALRVSNGESLTWGFGGLLGEPERAVEMGRRARALVETGRGAVERHLKIIATRLSSATFARTADQ